MTIRGGIFTTIPNKTHTGYISRGLQIRRSNVIVENLRHYVDDDGSGTVAPYLGFINIRDCSDIIIRNSALTGRRRTNMGSYDFYANTVVNLSLINLTQTNDINDDNLWGLMATNYTKNTLLENVRWSRFDAHRGVHNLTIRNSEFGHAGLLVIGGGDLRVENTIVRASTFMSFRGDYGSTWNGNVYITESLLSPHAARTGTPTVFSFSNDGNWNFGYICHMPRIITIDGLRIDDFRSASPPQLINGDFVSDHSGRPFPMVLTEEIRIRNLTTETGRPLASLSAHLQANITIVNW